MNRSRFVTWLLVLFVVFVFLKIYQHNGIVKLAYKKQKIERMKGKLEKKRNSFLVELYKLKNQKRIVEKARSLGMVPLKPSQIITLTRCDFLQTLTVRT